MRYKAVFCDLGGTLLDDNKNLSNKAKDVVKRYVEKGGVFVINTGGTHVTATKYARQLPIGNQKISIISLQGAMIKDRDGVILHTAKIESEVAVEIIDELLAKGLYVQAHDEEVVLVNEEDEVSLDYQKKSDVELKAVGNISKYLKETKTCPLKIFAEINPSEADEYLKAFEKYRKRGVNFRVGKEKFLEFVSVKAGKYNGLKKACEIYGIDVCDVMAIGDNANDVDAVSQAGFGVVVRNAKEKVKSVASYVCESNNDDGAVKTIEKYCLID